MIIFGLVVLLIVGYIVWFGLPKPEPSPEEKAKADVQYYFAALAKKDWANVCSHLTLPAQQKISGSTTTCVDYLESSPPALQNRLAQAGRESRIVRVQIKGRDGVVTADRKGQQTISKVLLVKGVWVIDVAADQPR